MANENFEEQNLDNVQEMDNVPEDSHLLEVEHELKNDSGVEGKKWPGWPGENVFRMLVPVQKVGSIIGRKGEYIKKICEETKARIKILDGPPGTTERTVLQTKLDINLPCGWKPEESTVQIEALLTFTSAEFLLTICHYFCADICTKERCSISVSAKEEPDLLIPPALDGLLKIHKHVIDIGSDPANAPAGGTVCTRLLVAATHAGSLIGKQGATIKTIQDDSHCTVRVIGRENLPVVALPDDSVVEIQGEPAGLQKAVELIGTHLRKFLVDRSVIGVFEMQAQMPNARANQNLHPSQSWGPAQPPFPMNSGGPDYVPNHSHMAPPPHKYDNYYPPVDIPPLENQPRPGPPTYGRDMLMGPHATTMQPQQAVISKITQNIQIPLSYADAVIGVNGANISYIRRTSGATIAIQETKGVPGEMTVEINGSASQVQAAHQLIQNSIAEAASNGGGAMQSYNTPFYPSDAVEYAAAGYSYKISSHFGLQNQE